MQSLCGMMNQPKSPDSAVVQYFQVEAKSEKRVYPIYEMHFTSFRNTTGGLTPLGSIRKNYELHS